MNVQKVIENLKKRQKNSQKFWEVIQKIIEYLPTENIKITSPYEFQAELCFWNGNKWVKMPDWFKFRIKNNQLCLYQDNYENEMTIQQFLNEVVYFNFKDALKSFFKLIETLEKVYQGEEELKKLEEIRKILENN